MSFQNNLFVTITLLVTLFKARFYTFLATRNIFIPLIFVETFVLQRLVFPKIYSSSASGINSFPHFFIYKWSLISSYKFRFS